MSMSSQPAPQRSAGHRRYVDRSSAAAHVGICVRAIDQLTADGKLVAIRPTPRRVLYGIRDLDTYMAASKQPVVAN